MSVSDKPPVGLLLGSHIPPEQIADLASTAEASGFSELWFAEDYWFTGAVSAAAVALSVTKRIPVGLGIVSAMVRHPSVLAMEISTLARMFPSRFLPGIGLGLPNWLHQMGLHPDSQLRAMRDCIESIRRLLAGEELTANGTFDFDGIRLAYPLDQPVPIYAGVLGPKMMTLAGEVADGIVGSVLAGPEYIRWARDRVAEGAKAAGRPDDHRFAALVLFSVDADSKKAKDSLRPTTAWYLSAVPKTPLTDVYGMSDTLVELAKGGPEAIAREVPQEWLDTLTIAGDPEECVKGIEDLLAAGADSVVLYPMPAERTRDLVELAAAEVLPRVTARATRHRVSR
jgi:5,10-methylenetetrahydromethanopterin reductase